MSPAITKMQASAGPMFWHQVSRSICAGQWSGNPGGVQPAPPPFSVFFFAAAAINENASEQSTYYRSARGPCFIERKTGRGLDPAPGEASEHRPQLAQADQCFLYSSSSVFAWSSFFARGSSPTFAGTTRHWKIAPNATSASSTTNCEDIWSGTTRSQSCRGDRPAHDPRHTSSDTPSLLYSSTVPSRGQSTHEPMPVSSAARHVNGNNCRVAGD